MYTFLFLCGRGRSGKRFWAGIRDALGFRTMWRDFLEAFRAGECPKMMPEMAIEDLPLVQACYENRI